MNFSFKHNWFLTILWCFNYFLSLTWRWICPEVYLLLFHIFLSIYLIQSKPFWIWKLKIWKSVFFHNFLILRLLSQKVWNRHLFLILFFRRQVVHLIIILRYLRVIRIRFKRMIILLLLKVHFDKLRGLQNILNITCHSGFLLSLIEIVIVFIIIILVLFHEVVVWKLVQNVFTVIHFFFYFIFFIDQIILFWNLAVFDFCDCLKYRLILIIFLTFILLWIFYSLQLFLINLDFFIILILNCNCVI